MTGGRKAHQDQQRRRAAGCSRTSGSTTHIHRCRAGISSAAANGLREPDRERASAHHEQHGSPAAPGQFAGCASRRLRPSRDDQRANRARTPARSRSRPARAAAIPAPCERHRAGGDRPGRAALARTPVTARRARSGARARTGRRRRAPTAASAGSSCRAGARGPDRRPSPPSTGQDQRQHDQLDRPERDDLAVADQIRARRGDRPGGLERVDRLQHGAPRAQPAALADAG